MDRIKLPQNRGYLIAGIGALVALLAFLLLPYIAITSKTVASSTGFTGITSSTSYYFTTTLNATALTQSEGNGFSPFAATSAGQGEGTLWLLPILALVAMVLTGLLLYREQPFGKMVNAPVENQRKWSNYGLIGIAALSVLIQIITITNMNSQITANNTSSSGSGITSVTTTNHIGFWLYLLGMVAVGGGAIFLMVQANKQGHAALSMPVTNMSAVPPSQPWQSPVSSVPPNPYAQPYSPGSQQEWAQPSQPAQPPYPAQQWPPSSNSPQPPYSSGQ